MKTHAGGDLSLLFFFFFFQAEDGIRDIGVTGVQTCALPIYIGGPIGMRIADVVQVQDEWPGRALRDKRVNSNGHVVEGRSRSEERRVGEEGRSRWAPYH